DQQVCHCDTTATTQLYVLSLHDALPISCGEAIERTAECKKDTSWWNPRRSYGMLAAQALDAQVHLVCFGGRGLIRSWNGKTDEQDRKSTRLNSSHVKISYAVFCLKKKKA